MRNLSELDLKIENKDLLDSEYTHFDVYKIQIGESYEDFMIKISKETEHYMKNYYYCMPNYIYNYIFVKVWSGRSNAIYTSNLISNLSQHKLKDVRIVGKDSNSILLVFKDRRFCNPHRYRNRFSRRWWCRAHAPDPWSP